MPKMPKEHASKPASNKGFLFFCAIVAHGGWGLYPGFTRYLQTQAHLGSFQVLALSMGVPALFLGVYILYENWNNFRQIVSMSKMWVYLILVICLNILFVFSTRLTQSIYVQLILLGVPFFVAFLAKFLLKRPLPPYTIPAIIISTIGAIVALFGDVVTSPQALQRDDYIGFGLALLTALSLSGFIVFCGRVEHTYSINLIVFWNIFPVGIITFALSLIIEYDDWNLLLNLSVQDWIVFVSLGFGVYLFINLIFLFTIRNLGPALVGTLLPFRLVIAFLLGSSPLLNEELTIYNIIGSVMVMVTLSCYLYLNYRIKEKNAVKDRRTTDASVQSERLMQFVDEPR